MACKILVVDDVASNRIILKAKLSIACYDVVQAADGAQALALARAARPDLILLDLAMPEMDGLAVLAALKGAPETAAIPVVVVSSHSDVRTRLAALRAGAEDFLTKPVDDAILTARVRSLLRAQMLAEELELRESTRTALGFAEPQARFAGPAPAAAERACRIALVGPERAGIAACRAALAANLPHRIDVLSRAAALGLARSPAPEAGARAAPFDGSPVGPSETSPAERPAEPPAERPAEPPVALRADLTEGAADGSPIASTPPLGAAIPDVFVLAADLARPGDGLLLLSELRASPTTRHSAILMLLGDERGEVGPIALDLGASDLLLPPFHGEEVALRVAAQLRRKRRADALRRRLRDGLQMAVTDPLTGLANRRYALSHLGRAAERAARRGKPLAALLLDIDRFKAVNDAHGHAAGDAVLRAVAERLRSELRPGDLLSRIGGEEFLAVLPDLDGEEALAAAERLRLSLSDRPVPLPGGAGAVAPTVSVGVAVAPAGALPGTWPGSLGGAASACAPRGSSGGAPRESSGSGPGGRPEGVSGDPAGGASGRILGSGSARGPGSGSGGHGRSAPGGAQGGTPAGASGALADDASGAAAAGATRDLADSGPAGGVPVASMAAGPEAGQVAPTGGVTAEALLARADRALYRAKAAGRDRVAIDRPEDPDATAAA